MVVGWGHSHRPFACCFLQVQCSIQYYPVSAAKASRPQPPAARTSGFWSGSTGIERPWGGWCWLTFGPTYGQLRAWGRAYAERSCGCGASGMRRPRPGRGAAWGARAGPWPGGAPLSAGLALRYRPSECGYARGTRGLFGLYGSGINTVFLTAFKLNSSISYITISDCIALARRLFLRCNGDAFTTPRVSSAKR